jgi:hypothetical protein
MVTFFSLMKRTKNQVSKKASLRSMPFPANWSKPGLQTIAPWLRPLKARASENICYALHLRS